MITLWMAGWYFNQDKYTRQVWCTYMSVTSISGDTQKLLKKKPSLFITSLSLTSARRITGFRLSLGLLALLTVLGTLGIASSFLDEYLDFSVAKKLRHF
ncbi:hypothetical protein E2I00_020111 [Balaenoptera physalus]|uniref:Uncharacterized protein n=1 Tax=Balaenoptera physalus TaxID=9770 RepID=A0A643BYC9_BALPH|nr:hypothetical protein E2I00_020111 [Balaenoptera physalus]